ncbi:MAG: hypothetical protein E7384_02920 [Ruminococcaceae bacterium]|nr:hypothetical protein [Oscillospiraceae bacterium]
MKNEETDAFFDAVLSLKTKEDCYRFFEDICTINELFSITQRLEVAKMLKEGKTFSTIAAKTGASTATIARVNKCIRYGTGGYNLVLGDK